MTDQKTLYCLKTEGHNYFKIGITSQPIERRMAEIQNACPFKLEVFFTVLSSRAKKIETRIKDEMPDEFRARGGREWFVIDSVSMSEVIEAATSKDGDGRPVIASQETIGILRQIRGEMSHVEMAAKYKIAVATIYSWESGKRSPDKPSLVKLAALVDRELYLALLVSLGLLPAPTVEAVQE